MELFRFAMLLLVQLSPIFIYANGEAVTEYKCANERTSAQSVTSASAELTNGCVINGVDITFDIKAMHEAAAGKTPKTPVVIDITDAAFTNSNINLINAHLITGDSATQVPLLFTMSKTKMTGTSLIFGEYDETFKLPPYSRIRIIDSELTFSSAALRSCIFAFYSLQLVTNSSMEISRNVMTMDHKGVTNQVLTSIAAFFYLPSGTVMKISDKSSFTLQDNRITSNVREGSVILQFVWYQESSSLTISQNSIYTWVSNIISMVGHKGNTMYQATWYLGRNSALTISDTSSYTWTFNNISILGYDLKGGRSTFGQYVWWEDNDSSLTISQNSKYIWSMNSISMDGYDVTKMIQCVWYTTSITTISVLSQFLFNYNRMMLLARNYVSIESYVISIKTSSGTISGGSTMVWRDNCMGMGHKATDKRHVFRGGWSITGKGSELLLDGNYITTTDKYGPSDTELTQLVWGPKTDTDIKISNAGKLTIQNTKVHTNNATEGATDSMEWDSSLFSSKSKVKNPALEWSSSPAKDSDGSPIPTLDNTNLLQYMCVGLPGIPSRVTVTPTLIAPTKTKPVSPNVGPIPPVPPSPGKGDSNATLKANVTKTTDSVKSAAAILSAIPGVLITSVVFLCLYIW